MHNQGIYVTATETDLAGIPVSCAGRVRAQRTHCLPTLYLIDKRGRIRYVHIGEGAYEESERNIKALLAESYP